MVTLVKVGFFLRPASIGPVLLGLFIAFPSCIQRSPLRLLSEITEVRRLSLPEASLGYPVKVEGRVTFIDDLGKLIIVQDSQNGIRIDFTGPVPPLRVGQKVTITGITARGDFLPSIAAKTIVITDSSTQFPTPQQLTSKDLTTGNDDFQWVEASGILRRVISNSSGRESLEVETAAGAIRVTCFSQTQYSGSRQSGQNISLMGVLRTIQSLQGRLIRTEVWISTWNSVKSDQPIHPTSTISLPLQKTVADIRLLSLDEAVKGYPVRLKGVVTFRFPTSTNFFLQDSTGGIYVQNRVPGARPEPGDELELEGRTIRGSFLTDMTASGIKVFGKGTMPLPAGSMVEILKGRHRASWIQFEGIVLSVQAASGSPTQRVSGMITLQLLADSSRIQVTMAYPNSELPLQWVTKRVRIQGTCGSIYNQRRQFIRIRLYVPDPQYLTVLESITPESIPLKQIGHLLQVGPRGVTELLVRIRGMVTMPYTAGLEGFFLQDKSGGVLVRTTPTEILQVGDSIEVTGVPTMVNISPVFQSCSYHKAGTTTDAAPPLVLAEEALRGDFHSQLVRVEGYLSNEITTPYYSEFTLNAGDTPFTVRLDRSFPSNVLDDIRLGSLLEVTGICVVRTNENHLPESFHLLIRSPKDIVVVHQASWWTGVRIRGALILALLLTLGIIVWVILLQKQIRSQTALIRQKEERYRLLVENAPDIIFSCDRNHHILSVNQAAEKLTGYSQLDLAQMNLLQLVDPLYHDKIKELEYREMGSEIVNPYEIQIRTKDGRQRRMEINIGLLKEESKSGVRHGILRDITERSQLQEQLREAQKLEAVGQLAAGAAHHFNNFLTVILGNCELALTKVTADNPVYAKLTAIQKAGKEASKIAGNLQMFGRRQIRQGWELKVNELITSTEDMWRSFLGQEVQLDLQLEPQLDPIRIDPNHFQQALTNLIVNALDAMPQGGRITLRSASCLISEHETCDGCKEKLAPGRYILISIEDTGTGISEELQTRIFEPFFTTKEVGKGTGLGLSTAYGIIRQAGGSLWVQSTPGKGAKFTICLPSVSAPVA